MVTRGRPGRPFDDIRGRYAPATPTELTAAAAQAAQLNQRPDLARLALTELSLRLDNRRSLVPRTSGARLVRLTDSEGVDHAALEQLLVRTSDYEGADGYRSSPLRSLLAAYRLNAEPVPEIPEVTCLSGPGFDGARLATIAAMLRHHGYPASVNQIMPLGYVTKAVFGQVGPEPADRREFPRYPAPDENKTRRKIKIAVIDTGITDQPRGDGDSWLAGIVRQDGVNVDPLYEFGDALHDEQGTYLDFGAGHGTFVCGVIQQVAPFAEILVYRAIDGDGVGSDVDVAKALLQAVNDGARIINLSLGTETPDDQPPLATQIALEMIAEQSALNDPVIVIAAAGNNGGRRPVYPAAFSRLPGPLGQVVAVAGLTMNYEPAAWSSRGFWVDCSTGAEGVLSTFVRGQETEDMDTEPDSWTQESPWAIWTGSSFAAPQIAGALARRYQQEDAEPLQQSLNWLLKQGRSVPDFGRALEILPVGSGDPREATPPGRLRGRPPR